MESQTVTAPEHNKDPRDAAGNFLCPECLAEGKEVPYKAKTGLGSHRHRAHHILGSSASVISHRKASRRGPGRPAAASNTSKGGIREKILAILSTAPDGMSKSTLLRSWAYNRAPEVMAQVKALAKAGTISLGTAKNRGHITAWIKPLQIPATLAPQDAVPDGQPSLFQPPQVEIQTPIKNKLECPHCHKTFSGQRWFSRHINRSHPGLSVTPLPTSSLTVTPESHLATGKAHNGNNHDFSFTKEQLETLIQDQCSISHAAGYLEATVHRFAYERNQAPREYTQRVAEIFHANSRR